LTIAGRLPARLVALVALGTAALAVAATAAVAVDGKQATPHQRHFVLYEHDTSRQSIDLGDPGPSLGDIFAFGGNVSDAQGGPAIGRMAGSCTTTSDTEILCVAAFTLDGGQITYQGIVDTGVFFTGQSVEFAVTGGTGPYRNARGTLTGRILPEPTDGSDAQFIVDLT